MDQNRPFEPTTFSLQPNNVFLVTLHTYATLTHPTDHIAIHFCPATPPRSNNTSAFCLVASQRTSTQHQATNDKRKSTVYTLIGRSTVSIIHYRVPSTYRLPHPEHLQAIFTSTSPAQPRNHVFKILAATKMAAAVFSTHFCANSSSSSNVMLSVIPGNVTGAYPVSLPGAKIVCW